MLSLIVWVTGHALYKINEVHEVLKEVVREFLIHCINCIYTTCLYVCVEVNFALTYKLSVLDNR